MPPDEFRVVDMDGDSLEMGHALYAPNEYNAFLCVVSSGAMYLTRLQAKDLRDYLDDALRAPGDARGR